MAIGATSIFLSLQGGELHQDAEAKNSILITLQMSFDYIGESRPSAVVRSQDDPDARRSQAEPMWRKRLMWELQMNRIIR